MKAQLGQDSVTGGEGVPILACRVYCKYAFQTSHW